MKDISKLYQYAQDKSHFQTIYDYINFGKEFIEFIADKKDISAVITSQNEHNYKFIQYSEKANYKITRPINSNLFLESNADLDFLQIVLNEIDTLKSLNHKERSLLNSIIYTIQQSIGCALDALPANAENTAKKINGDLFERFMLFIFQKLNFDVNSKIERVFVSPDCPMLYQHDLAFNVEGNLALVGSVKTSSKDRIDKVFLDKLLYNKLQHVDIPHFAIFLNDIQRKKSTKEERTFSVSQTFLNGHFKAYTIALNPLDGVYYCDLRPIMESDDMLKSEIKRLDQLLCEDIWHLIKGKAR